MTWTGATRLKIWLVLLLVFALGCVTGASLDSVFHWRVTSSEREVLRRRHGKDGIFEAMKRDLNLDEKQSTEISAILEETRNELRALRAETRPRQDAVRQRARERMRALLTPEQQQRFDAKIAEHDARRERDDKDGR